MKKTGLSVAKAFYLCPNLFRYLADNSSPGAADFDWASGRSPDQVIILS